MACSPADQAQNLKSAEELEEEPMGGATLSAVSCLERSDVLLMPAEEERRVRDRLDNLKVDVNTVREEQEMLSAYGVLT